MPRRRRFEPRSQSTSSQSHVGSGNANDTTLNDPIVGVGPSNQQSSHEEVDSHEEIDTSIEADTDISPTQPCYKKKYNKYWTVVVIDENGKTREARLRVHDLFIKTTSEKIILEWNKENQPVGEASGLLGQFLGQVASNFDNFPICYEKWPKVPSSYKEHVWNRVIKEKFVLNDGPNKEYIMSSLGKKWRDNRADLFNVYYDPTADWDTNIENHPDSISREHWARFFTYRVRSSTQVIYIC